MDESTLPAGTNVMNCHYVFDLKRGADGPAGTARAVSRDYDYDYDYLVMTPRQSHLRSPRRVARTLSIAAARR